MKALIKTALSVLCFLCSSTVFAQDYSGTWYRHNDLISDDTFICKSNFSSLYDLYCIEIATAQAGADLKRLPDYRKAKEVAISAFLALAYGDVPTLKKCYSIDAYNEFFPYSDSYIRESLLNVPVDRRKRLIDHVNNAEITTVPNNAGDVVTLIFTNTTTGKIITLQLFDEQMNNNWKIIEIMY